jgi:hypothetical protein
VIDPAGLSGWTPIMFRGRPEPAIEWADLRAYPFDKPFFGEIIRDWRAMPTSASEWTGLEALDDAPALDPCVIIVHAARCGSTLLARQLAALDGGFLVSEPAVLEPFFADGVAGEAVAYSKPDVLRRLVRALGRVRLGGERRFVLKLSSRTIRFAPLVRRAFPGVPMIWLHRDPLQTVESELRSPGRWLGSGPLDVEALRRRVLHKHALVWLAAVRNVGEDMLVMDYDDLPQGAWTIAAPFIGVTPTTEEIRRMTSLAGLHAHGGEKVFAKRARDPLPDELAAQVVSSLQPLYRLLSQRRVAMG